MHWRNPGVGNYTSREELPKAREKVSAPNRIISQTMYVWKDHLRTDCFFPPYINLLTTTVWPQSANGKLEILKILTKIRLLFCAKND